MYPNGATQQGVLDMAGNVWEWCLNKHEQPGSPESLRIDDEGVDQRVKRGGSWVNATGGLRSSDRDRPNPEFRFSGTIGFRLAQDIE
jgi:formylglycine-generating enzyme required for sulfatase activity